jgi:hypothetical protein
VSDTRYKKEKEVERLGVGDIKLLVVGYYFSEMTTKRLVLN